jgi:hypothetical protein
MINDPIFMVRWAENKRNSQKGIISLIAEIGDRKELK